MILNRTGIIKELRMQIFILIQKMKLDIAFLSMFFLSLFALDAKPRNDTLLVEIDISFKQATSSAPCTTFWEEITCFQMHGVMNGLGKLKIFSNLCTIRGTYCKKSLQFFFKIILKSPKPHVTQTPFQPIHFRQILSKTCKNYEFVLYFEENEK